MARKEDVPQVVFTVVTTEKWVLAGDEEHTEYNGQSAESVIKDWFGREVSDQYGMSGTHASRDYHRAGGTRVVLYVGTKVFPNEEAMYENLYPDPPRKRRGR